MPAYLRMVPIAQRLYDRTLQSMPETLNAQLSACGLADRIRPGASIAITAGSRGIHNIPALIRETASFIRRLGANPFVVPAMGSHGGSTAEGQLELLHSLGVTEEAVGAPILSSMETVRIGEVDGLPVFMDRYAWESDGVVVVNRVKPHTDFRGPHESGIVKMITIGLGKRDQAELVHSRGTRGLRELIPLVADAVIRTGKILAGVAITENGRHQIASITACPPEDILATDRRLLAAVKRRYPRLPFDEIDILIVDYLGKDISGAGMDTNVIGRLRLGTEPWTRRPAVRTIVVLDVTDASHGNAVGLGLADITTQRLIDRMDRHATLTNTMVSTFVERGFTPLVFPTDREAFEAAVFLNRHVPPNELKIVRIQSTLHVEKMLVSEAMLGMANKPIIQLGPPQPMDFTPDGRFAQEVPS
ncbi:MAG: DUF2088 domain-containing protein [Armatimonadota bacterium]